MSAPRRLSPSLLVEVCLASHLRVRGEKNTLGNIKSAIRSISSTVQPHIIRQLTNTADSIYRIVKCEKLKVKDVPTGEDLTAMQF